MFKKLIALICMLSLLTGIAPLQAMAAADAKGPAKVTEDGFGYVVQDDQTVCIVDFPENVEDLVIPSEIDGLPVTVIDTNPEAEYVQSIKNENYKSIYIPDSVIEIGRFAFMNCLSAKSVRLSGQLKVIQGQAFQNAKSLESIAFPDSLEEIYGYAFFGCSHLNDISFPDKLIRIYGKDVFGDTPWFTKQTPQNGMTIIGHVLLDASGTTGAVEIPDSVEMIGCDAFEGCADVTSVHIPSSVKIIELEAFLGCTKLETIEIPESVDEFYYDAFKDTPWLAHQRAENPLVIVNGTLIDAQTAKGNIVIPDTVHQIAESAFSNNTDLNTIEIPDSVTIIHGMNCEDNVVIRCNYHSVAHQYVKNHGIAYELMDTTGLVYGDMDQNALVDANDALSILQISAKLISADGEKKAAGDVDGNGAVDAADALLVLQKAARIIDVFSVESKH